MRAFLLHTHPCLYRYYSLSLYVDIPVRWSNGCSTADIILLYWQYVETTYYTKRNNTYGTFSFVSLHGLGPSKNSSLVPNWLTNQFLCRSCLGRATSLMQLRNYSTTDCIGLGIHNEALTTNTMKCSYHWLFCFSVGCRCQCCLYSWRKLKVFCSSTCNPWLTV